MIGYATTCNIHEFPLHNNAPQIDKYIPIDKRTLIGFSDKDELVI